MNLPDVLVRVGAIWNGESEPVVTKVTPEIDGGGLSVVGPVREDNQDSIHLPDGEQTFIPGSLFALADGMGGYAYGGVASLLALETFSRTLAVQKGIPIPKALQRGVETANLQVYQKAHQLQAGRMGTTLTAAYVSGDLLYLAHVGDSRAYLIREGRSFCLTSDHTVVGDMVRSKLISHDRVRTHAQRSYLTRSLGTALFVQPDIIRQKLMEGDRLVLCSDGVWSVLDDEELAGVASQPASVDEISRNLIDLALLHQTDDNASVVVFHLRKLTSHPTEHDSYQEQKVGWFQNLGKFLR
jgi:PPM family protein phosphatase